MAKGGARNRCRFSAHRFRSTPYPIPQPYRREAPQANLNKTLALERKEWEDATCSVCMEFPHNAVLLLCSSYKNGCRPYMCGTSYRHSNCLHQFKKAYTKAKQDNPSHHGRSEILELACPLCRGQVKGWTVVEHARKYLNKKKRTCMQDGCSFVGTYKKLKRHVRNEHPCTKPREIDPEMEEKWRLLEDERERQDVISTLRSSTPRSVVFGDYIIDVDDDNGDEVGEFRGNRGGISRSIVYFFLQEGARLLPDGADISAAGGDERDNDIFGSHRRHRRARRRSRLSSTLDII